MKDEFMRDICYKKGLIIKIVPNIIFFILLTIFLFAMEPPVVIWFFVFFCFFSVHFLPFITLIISGVIIIREIIFCKGDNHLFALIALLLSICSVVSEIFVLITVKGIYASELLFINGGLILAIWGCWIVEFIVRKKQQFSIK